MGTLDSIRVFMALVTGVVLLVLLVRYFKVSRIFSRTLKFFMFSMFFLLITAAWDTLVLIGNEDPFSFRMFPYAIGLTLAIMALAEPPDVMRKRFSTDTLDRDGQLKSLRIEVAELRDKLYDSLRRENVASTKLLILKAEQREREEQGRHVDS
jgi:hypothetical protein